MLPYHQKIKDMEQKQERLIELMLRKLEHLTQTQEEFYQKHFLALSTANKTILTQEEAAAYIGHKSSYLNQLTHHGRLKFIKRQGQKSKYFLKKDLEAYMVGNVDSGENPDELETEILNYLDRGNK